MDSYAPFPFLPPVVPGKYGKVYEFRTYHLKPGGLPPTIAAWEAALPERNKLSPLIINMYALDGAPRNTHIWPYARLGRAGNLAAEECAGAILRGDLDDRHAYRGITAGMMNTSLPIRGRGALVARLQNADRLTICPVIGVDRK
jgi:hypothetical protein